MFASFGGIGEGGARLVLPGIGELTGANGHLVSLGLGAGMIWVASRS